MAPILLIYSKKVHYFKLFFIFPGFYPKSIFAWPFPDHSNSDFFQFSLTCRNPVHHCCDTQPVGQSKHTCEYSNIQTFPSSVEVTSPKRSALFFNRSMSDPCKHSSRPAANHMLSETRITCWPSVDMLCGHLPRVHNPNPLS